MCLGNFCSTNSPKISVLAGGNLYANRIESLTIPVSTSFDVVSSIDYETLDLDAEMDASLKAFVKNPESDDKGTPIYLMKIGDRETGSDTFT